MAQDNDNRERDALQRVLDAYGGDHARWPASARTRFERLLERDAASRRLVAETRALDRVLDRAPLPDRQRTADAAARIMAAVATLPQSDGTAGATAAAPSSGGRVIALPPRPHTAAGETATPRTMWQAAALIAACLLAGIYIDAGSSVLPVMQDVADSVGIVAELDPSSLVSIGDFDDEDGP
jgi:hypothetical protein